MVGRLRLAASPAHPALHVPDTAIATDAARRVVYIVDRKDTVAMRPVQLGPLTGNLRVIRSGLSLQDRVIIGGIQRAMPGQKVKVRKGRIMPPASSEPDVSPPQIAPASTATPVAQTAGR
jgi:multidrug efflux pump subunit AcrA (membrane-fusion protein)